jgi:GTP cyclohydrolase I
MRCAASESVILTDEQRAVMTKQIAEKYKEIFNLAKLDYLNDENLKDTPFRIASMYVNELMVGRYSPAPRIEAFPANYYNLIQQDKSCDNDDLVYAEKAAKAIHKELDEITEKFYKYAETDPVVSNYLLKTADKLLTQLAGYEEEFLPKADTRNMVVKSVDVNSLCSHHFIPFVSTDEKDSRAVIAYIPRLGSNKAAIIDGLENYIVVDTEKALLICPISNDQLIKDYVLDLKNFKKGEKFM